MNKLEIVKKATSFVVGSGTGTIAGSIIRNNVAPGNVYQKVSVLAASIVIGSMASEATRDHTEKQIDQIANFFGELRSNN